MKNQQKLNEKYIPVLLYCISSFKGSSCKKVSICSYRFLFLVVLHQFLYHQLSLLQPFDIIFSNLSQILFLVDSPKPAPP